MLKKLKSGIKNQSLFLAVLALGFYGTSCSSDSGGGGGKKPVNIKKGENSESDARSKGISKVDSEKLNQALKLAVDCMSSGNLGLLAKCLQGKQIATDFQKSYQSTIGTTDVQTTILQKSDDGSSIVGLLVYGLTASSDYTAYVGKGDCSVKPGPYQHIEGNDKAVESQIELKFSADANGNALTFSAGAFSISDLNSISYVIESANGEYFCLDSTKNIENSQVASTSQQIVVPATVTPVVPTTPAATTPGETAAPVDNPGAATPGTAVTPNPIAQIPGGPEIIQDPDNVLWPALDPNAPAVPKPGGINAPFLEPDINAIDPVTGEPGLLPILNNTTILALYTAKIAPILQADCANCHGGAGNWSFNANNPQNMMQLITAGNRFNAADPANSAFILKGDGQLNHGGGLKLSGQGKKELQAFFLNWGKLQEGN